MPRPASLPSVFEAPANGDPERDHDTDSDSPDSDTDSTLDSTHHDAYVPSDIPSDSDSCDDNREKKTKKSLVNYSSSDSDEAVAEPWWDDAPGRDGASGPVGDSSPAPDQTPDPAAAATSESATPDPAAAGPSESATPDPAAAGPSESAAPNPTPAPRPMWAPTEGWEEVVNGRVWCPAAGTLVATRYLSRHVKGSKNTGSIVPFWGGLPPSGGPQPRYTELQTQGCGAGPSVPLWDSDKGFETRNHRRHLQTRPPDRHTL